MPKIYTNPIGPLPGGGFMPSESLAGQATMAAMGAPLPNLTGGAAGPSGATGSSSTNFINNVSGSGGVLLWISLALVGYIAWKKFR